VSDVSDVWVEVGKEKTLTRWHAWCEARYENSQHKSRSVFRYEQIYEAVHLCLESREVYEELAQPITGSHLSRKYSRSEPAREAWSTNARSWALQTRGRTSSSRPRDTRPCLHCGRRSSTRCACT